MKQLEEIKQKIQAIKPELEKKFHVNSIGLFGSVVRSDYNINSDIDILVEFKKTVGIEFIDLADYLEVLLQRKIDLVSRNDIKSKYLK